MTHHPQRPARDQRLDELLAEYMRLADHGAEDREAFLAAHPEDADALRELLDTEQEVIQLAGPLALDESDRIQAELLTQPLPTGPDEETQAAPPVRHAVPLEIVDPLPFGNYELLELLGRGGMGVVYRARQKGLDRDVALKMILNSRLASEEDIQRFHTEARAAANIRHEHVVDIYEIGEVEGQHFFSMELIIGSDLARVLREGRLESRRAAMLLRDAASAVHAAHQIGLLHRDIKPGNILIEEGDRVVVTDFGLAREFDDADQQRLTSTGLAMGTPLYMSPEQASGKRDKMAATSDVYSLGTVLYAMLTGSPPHRGATVMDTLMAVVHKPVANPLVVNPDADPPLCRICLKCLSKEPEDRYQSAAELVDDLNRYLDGRPVVAQGRHGVTRAVAWAGQLPVVAALRGRTVHHPSPGQLRAQAALILALLLSMVALVAAPQIRQYAARRMPRQIRIAGGMSSGVYHKVAERLAPSLQRAADIPVIATSTNGALANRERLLERSVELALLQESVLGSEQIVVIAPMFDELVHVLVRTERISSWDQLTGKRIAVGRRGSGSAWVADRVLAGTSFKRVERHFVDVFDEDPSQSDVDVDAAVLTLGRDSPLVSDAVARDWRLLEMPEKVIHSLAANPRFQAVQIPAKSLLPRTEAGVVLRTVATPAFLACRRDAPDRLVRCVLECIYPALLPHQISREQARQWDFMPLHPEARRYFEEGM